MRMRLRRKAHHSARFVSVTLLIAGSIGLIFGLKASTPDLQLIRSAASRLYDRTLDCMACVIVGRAELGSDSDSTAADDLVGFGSGFYISPHIMLTNAHVTRTERLVDVRPGYGELTPGFVVYADTLRDVAIVYTDETRPWLPLRADDPAPGEVVYAIGSPGGHLGSMSEGVVTGSWYEGGRGVVIFTNVIAPGSSGGALIDGNGRLVGMTSEYDHFGLAVDVSTMQTVFGFLRKACEESGRTFAEFASDGHRDSVQRSTSFALTHRDSLALGWSAETPWSESAGQFAVLLSLFVLAAGLLGSACTLFLSRREVRRRIARRTATLRFYDDVRTTAFVPDQVVLADCGPPERWYNRPLGLPGRK